MKLNIFSDQLTINSTKFNSGTKFGELLAESLVEKSYSRDINSLFIRVSANFYY
jgi:hypothetical protein